MSKKEIPIDLPRILGEADAQKYFTEMGMERALEVVVKILTKGAEGGIKLQEMPDGEALQIVNNINNDLNDAGKCAKAMLYCAHLSYIFNQLSELATCELIKAGDSTWDMLHKHFPTWEGRDISITSKTESNEHYYRDDTIDTIPCKNVH